MKVPAILPCRPRAARTACLASALLMSACNVESAQGSGTGADLSEVSEACPAALVVTSSDYTSTNVALLSPEGRVATESLVSSASTDAGLTTPLSGDVVSPSERSEGTSVVLIDRYPNAVLTWVDPATARVERQVSVGTGFGSNPHDYLQVASTKAYVTRYESNPSPGAEPYDAGGDLLIVDPSAGVIAGSVSLADPDDGALLPRPDHLHRVGDRVWVSLGRIDASYAETGDSRVVGVDLATDERVFSVDLVGLAGCSTFAASPSGRYVAMACTGALAADATSLERSGVIVLDASKSPPTEVGRFDVAAELESGPSPSLAFVNETLLLGTTYGDFSGTKNDVAYTLDTGSGKVTQLFDSGSSYVLGDARCLPGCSERCFLADAAASVVHMWEIGPSGLGEESTLSVNEALGLPPRGLGER